MVLGFEGCDWITADPAVQDGKPCVQGMRITVQRVLDVLATNPSWADLRTDHSELEDEDVAQVLAFASASHSDRIIPRQMPVA